MKITTIAFIIILLATVNIQAQIRSLPETLPDSLLENADAVILNEENTLKITGTSNATYHYKLRALNLNPNSPFTDFIIPYDNNLFVYDLRLSILDAKGSLIKSYTLKDFESYSAFSSMYSDSKVYVFKETHPIYPHIVEIQYTQNLKWLLNLPNWDILPDYRVSILNSSYTLKHPSNRDVLFSFRNIAVEGTEKTSSGNVVHNWTVSNLPAIPDEPYAPPAKSYLPRMLVTTQKFKYEGYTFEMDDWPSFARSMYALFEGRSNLSNEMKEQIHRLTDTASTTEAKIAALYRYLQENTRYVSVQLGIGGYQPFPASYVEKNKYGDCKALTNFMMAILNEAGIPARPAVIYRGNEPPELLEDMPYSGFNHVLLYLPEEDSWLECTSNYYPPGYIGSDNSNRKALLLDELNGQLIDMPRMDTALNVLEVETETVLLPSGKFHIKLSERRRGFYYEPYAYGQRELKQEDLIRWYRRESALPTFTLQNYQLEIPPDQAEARIQMEITTDHLAIKAGKRELYPLITGSPFTEVPPRNKDRQLPVYTPHGLKKIERGVFHLPSGKSVEIVPESRQFESPYGRYRLTVQQEGSEIRFERELILYSVSLPPEEYNAWRSFLRKVAKADGAKVVVVNP